MYHYALTDPAVVLINSHPAAVDVASLKTLKEECRL